MPVVAFDRDSYAEVAELTSYGLPDALLAGVTYDEARGFLCMGSDMVDGAAGDQYDTPLTEWSGDVRMYVCWIAAYLIVSKRGYNPEGSDIVFFQRYQEAQAWLEKIASGSRRIPGGKTRGPTATGGPLVLSSPRRGF